MPLANIDYRIVIDVPSLKNWLITTFLSGHPKTEDVTGRDFDSVVSAVFDHLLDHPSEYRVAELYRSNMTEVIRRKMDSQNSLKTTLGFHLYRESGGQATVVFMK